MGAEVVPEGVCFRVWAPRCERVEVVVEGPSGSWPVEMDLDVEGNGYFSGLVPGAGAGALYRFRLDDGEAFPDPASRFQPQGPYGPSQVVDPATFEWTDEDWPGIGRDGQVLYEMHIGTFTPEGTWGAAARELPELADLGITVLELMPVAEFPGEFGWGYDGVDLFAPYHVYGTPDDFRRFVDRAHAAGIGVILDVVYNHLGPDGNSLKRFSESYFTDRYKNDWGEAINFDGEDAGPVREFFLTNAGYWIQEFHLDGLRLDATQDVHDASDEHILVAIARRVREAAGKRSAYIVSENEPQDTRLVRPREEGGYGHDALWNDDFHHSTFVALTGRNEAYYTDYKGSPQEMISLVKYGYLYQGQRYSWQKQRRGTSALGLPPSAFVNFLQNHDQVANSARGERCHKLASPGKFRALTAL
ncbi:MAG TPA: alpha-amylase family glycosyl hydrolase, partial [Thermoanaerobaculia bacterium]|nr:alpha-amylase family glycosyl hydrolase [Thermoanaerobaculia bacterium]